MESHASSTQHSSTVKKEEIYYKSRALDIKKF